MIHKISNGSVKASVEQTGAYITEWKIGDEEIVFPANMRDVNGEQKLRGGIPVCFPFLGSAKEYKGKKIAQHGFWRTKTFKDLSMNAEVSAMFFKGTLVEEGLSYDVEADYVLRPKVKKEKVLSSILVQTIRTRASKGYDLQPICLGLHPYFVVDKSIFELKIDGEVVIKNVKAEEWLPRFIKTEKFPILASCEIKLKKNLSVTMKLEKGFLSKVSMVCVWTDADGYICVEPVMGDSHEFGSQKGWYIDGDQKEYTVSYEARLEDE